MENRTDLRRGRKLPRHCHPYQFLLKSFRFPGAKTAGKRFLLWKMGFSAAKILPCPPYMPLGTIEIREGFGPLELSRGFSTVWAGERRLLRFFRGERGRLAVSETKMPAIGQLKNLINAFFRRGIRKFFRKPRLLEANYSAEIPNSRVLSVLNLSDSEG